MSGPAVDGLAACSTLQRSSQLCSQMLWDVAEPECATCGLPASLTPLLMTRSKKACSEHHTEQQQALFLFRDVCTYMLSVGQSSGGQYAEYICL